MKIITDENYKNMKRAKDFYGEIKEIFNYNLNNDIEYTEYIELPEGVVQSCTD